MKKVSFCFISLVWLCKLHSQNWVNVIDSMPNSHVFLYSGVTDTINNILYIGGGFEQINNLRTKAIIKYDGVKFDTLGAGLDPQWASFFSPTIIRKTIIFQNKLYVGGQFEKAGKYYSPNLARWNGVDWDTVNFNPNGVVKSMEVYKNELYVMGDFDTIAGTACHNVAKYNGTNWQSLSFPFSTSMVDIAIFQDTLYATGPFYQSGFSMLAKYNGTNWIAWRGVTGDANKGVFGLKVIDTMLFVYGRFYSIAGANCNGLVSFNGKKWFGYGNGVTPTSYAYINDITKIDGELIVSGNFDFIDGISTSNGQQNFGTNIAKFDGHQWCTFIESVGGGVNYTIKYNNDMYIAGAFLQVGNTPVLPLLKWTGGNTTISCGQTINLGITENFNEQSISIYPNPVQSILTIDDEQNQLQNSIITIINTLGETVLVLPFSHQINISSLAQGLYYLTLQDGASKKVAKIVKQ